MAQGWRTVRVFISSTFRDMQAERDHLVKFTFPKLRKLCESRGVVWGEVDLRWGVTDEQKSEGKVLPICLAEIHRCRPYFIGLLGERYGWIPDEIPQEIVEQEKWIAELRGHSVTELEILHGVLRNPDMANHAFFYFRDPEASKKLEPELAKHPDYEPESPESLEKLRLLKQKIENSGFPVRKDFPDAKSLDDLIVKDFTDLINKLYPEDSKPDPLDREASEHETYAQSRAGVYIGREEYFRRLDEHAESDGQPLVVLGDSGIGKSALLSNWAIKYRETNPDKLLLMHFIGASAYSADWAAMLRRIMGEFKRKFNIQQEIPDKPDELRTAFANWLHMATAKGRVILILDALNQLENRDGAPDLVWLPPVIPANIRLILSTLPGRPLDDIKKRDWPTLTVEPFNQDERKSFIKKYLGQYTKALSPDRANRVADSEQTNNPLYLQALLEELRVFGAHERLDERINYYLEAQSIPALYERILTRYEEDYERDRPGLVRDALSLIWAARRGLSESELLDMLGSDEKPLPRAIWSPLFLAAERSLMNRSGLIGFSHDYFRQAVQNKYLAAEQEQHAAHLRITDYFEKRKLTWRKIDELHWQLAKSSQWERLRNFLSSIDIFMAAVQLSKWDVLLYWQKIEAYSNISMAETYRGMVARALLAYDATDDSGKAALSMVISWVSDLYMITGHFEESLDILKFQMKEAQRAGDKNKLSVSLDGQAAILRIRGDMDGAMSLLREQKQICREIENKEGLASSLGNQGRILGIRGDKSGAMTLYKEAERISRELGDKKLLSNILGMEASILLFDDIDSATAMNKESEQICREIGDKEGLAWCLNGQGKILSIRGDIEGGKTLYKESERIFREIGNKRGLASSLYNQAETFANRFDMVGAVVLYKEAEKIYREFGMRLELASSLLSQAIILSEILRRHIEALPLAEEALELYTQMRIPLQSIASAQVSKIRAALK